MIFFNKEICISGEWHHLGQCSVMGADELFKELIKIHADRQRSKSSIVTSIMRRFHGEEIEAEASFSLRNFLAFADDWKRHHRDPRKEFGCFPFDYIDQIDEDVMGTLKKNHAIESIRVIAWVA